MVVSYKTAAWIAAGVAPAAFATRLKSILYLLNASQSVTTPQNFVPMRMLKRHAFNHSFLCAIEAERGFSSSSRT